RLKEPGSVTVTAKVAALLEPKPTKETEAVRGRKLTEKPYWDLERSRVGDTRKVPVEVVVNGIAVDKTEIVADGTEQDVKFTLPVKQSSWVCLRIFPSSHTNPVFVLVGEKPIRASKKSAEWCLKGIDNCWEQKSKTIQGYKFRTDEEKARELKEMKDAYDKAREEYRKILNESAGD